MNHRTESNILGHISVRKELEKKFEDENGVIRCVSCNATPTEWHHVVPIEVGGKDAVSNIVPVCPVCHKLIHYGESLRLQRLAKARESIKSNGRHRSVPENYKELLNDYVYCRIGKKELSERWGVTVTSRTEPGKQIPVDMVRLTGKSWYRDYLKELGIEKVENHVDYLNNLRSARTVIRDGEYVGTIFYRDGRVEEIYHNAPAKIV